MKYLQQSRKSTRLVVPTTAEADEGIENTKDDSDESFKIPFPLR